MKNVSRRMAGSLLALFALFGAVCLWYHSVYLIQESGLPAEVEEKIRGSQKVDLGQLIDGEWDNLILIAPYTDADAAREKFGVNLNRLANDSIRYGEGQLVLLFCRENEIESYVYLPNTLAVADEALLKQNLRIPREEAVFLPIQGVLTQIYI